MVMFLLLFLLFPLSAAAQMMPARLAKPDTAAITTKNTTSQPLRAAKAAADTTSKIVGETAVPVTVTQLPERQGPQPMSSFEFWLSVIVLGFTLLLLITLVWLIRAKLLSAESSLRAILVTIIIGATLFLITAGYSNDQIAPAVGLFGTIAGYLLGRNSAAMAKEG